MKAGCKLSCRSATETIEKTFDEENSKCGCEGSQKEENKFILAPDEEEEDLKISVLAE